MLVVRIMGDDQYRIEDSLMPQIEQLETSLHAALDKNDEAVFFARLKEIHDLVRKNGTMVAYEEVVPSNIILPAEDMTIDEVKQSLDVDPSL